MMAASDERLEVAARLRAKQEECDTRLYPWTTDDIISALGYTYDFEVDNNLLARLADLIDPTCHIVTTAEGIIGCDRCRTVMLAVRAKPSFCPNCGARVVSGGAE